MDNAPSIGWSDFARKQHTPFTGNTYTNLSEETVAQFVRHNWDQRKPGYGETDVSRKVVVPINNFYPNTVFLPVVDLDERLSVQAKITRRQEGEKAYVETFVYEDDVKALGLKLREPRYVNAVCYSVEALLENDGTRSTDCDWEIVALLGSMVQEEPMTPLTMARNFLAEVGGTKTNYTPLQFAEAIWYHNINRGIRVVRRPS